MKRILFALLVCLLAPMANAAAHSRVALQVVDLDRGRELPQYRHGHDRYVAGEMGQRYAVRLQNLSNRRLLVVLSVDGINAVTGQTASPEQSGYVLNPYQSTEVRGWRKSLQEVAEFAFSAEQASYAAHTGRPRNIGVIGIAVFEEQALPIWREPAEIAKSAPAPGASTPQAKSRAEQDFAPQDRSLGTAHGQRRYDPAQHTSFRRSSTRPLEVQEVFYDSRRNLMAAGIISSPDWRYARRADPFPNGFVPDPY